MHPYIMQLRIVTQVLRITGANCFTGGSVYPVEVYIATPLLTGTHAPFSRATKVRDVQ